MKLSVFTKQTISSRYLSLQDLLWPLWIPWGNNTLGLRPAAEASGKKRGPLSSAASCLPTLSGLFDVCVGVRARMCVSLCVYESVWLHVFGCMHVCLCVSRPSSIPLITLHYNHQTQLPPASLSWSLPLSPISSYIITAMIPTVDPNVSGHD